MKDCVFCKIVSGEIPSYKIYEDDIVYVFLDNEPDSNGHMLIIPKKHIVDTKDMLREDNLLNHMINVAEKMREIIKEKIGINGLRYLWNMDNAQNVKHLHIHVIPCDKTIEKMPELMDIEKVYNIIKNIT